MRPNGVKSEALKAKWFGNFRRPKKTEVDSERDADRIEQFIREKGVTKCPTVFLVPTRK